MKGSAENLCFSKDMAMRNTIFERKLAVVQRSHEQQQRISKLYSQSRDYLEKLISQTNEKIDNANKEIESKHVETKRYVEESIQSLCSDFGHVDILNNNKKLDPTIDENLLNRFLNVPHEDLTNKLQNFKIELEKQLQMLKNSISSTEVRIGETRKSRESLSKEQFKEEKTISEWEALVEKKTELSIQLEADVSSKFGKLADLEAACHKLEKEKYDFVFHLLELEKKMKEETDIESKVSTDLLKKKNLDLKAVEDRIQEVSSCSNYDEWISLELPQYDVTIMEMLGKLEQAKKDLAQATKETGANDSLFEMTIEDNLETLSAESKVLQDQKQKMELEITKMKDLRHKLLLQQQENADGLTELEAARERVRQKTLKLKLLVKAKRDDSLKKLEAAKEVDVPVVRNIDYTTPEMRKSLSSAIKKNKQTRQSSFESKLDFTKATVEDLSYPGIRQLSRSTKKRIQEASSQQFAQTVETVKQRDSVAENMNFDSSMDSSLVSADTGTTQEGSMMGGMFSPLSNRFEEDDLLLDKDVEDQVDFSMMDHFRDYTDRSMKPMKHSNTASNVDMTATPSPQDSVSQRFASDIFLKGNTPSEMSLDTSEPSVLMSSLNGGDEEDNEDEDDSLMADDSDLDMDQSVWGSDV